MTHELLMLRSYKTMKRLAKSLTEETHFKIVKSYAVEMNSANTFDQFKEICDQMQTRDTCALFVSAVERALALMDKPFAALLAQVYFKRVEPSELAARYRVTARAVYVKLRNARMMFKECLDSLGYTRDWFERTFAHFDFLMEKLS